MAGLRLALAAAVAYSLRSQPDQQVEAGLFADLPRPDAAPDYPDVSDQLPPEQALDIVNHTPPITTATSLNGNSAISLNSEAVEKK